MAIHTTLGLDAGRQVAKQAAGHPVIEFCTSQTEGSEGSQSSSGPDTCRHEHVFYMDMAALNVAAALVLV